MRTRHGQLLSLRRLAAVGFVIAFLGAAGARAQDVPVASGEPLRLAAPVRPVKSGTAVYIVQLKEPGAASYSGGKTGLAATKPSVGRKLDRASGAVQTYVKQLEQTHDRLLAEIGAPGSKVYSFRYSLNGFAARLSAAQVSRLAQNPDVERIWLDSEQRVQTNNSAIFLGLEDQEGGLRADLKLRGENVVIGVIDSGVAPGHPSLADTVEHVPRLCTTHWARASWLGLFLCSSLRNNPPTELVYDPPAAFHGICQTGEGFTISDCNNKVVGARFYVDGFLAQHELDPGEHLSPRDADGHGTHVATIAAGNPVSAYLFGTRVARVSGIAPRARVAVYKACWLEPGATGATCATSDLAMAIDDAVADGVDIINYSVGTTLQETDLTAPDDRALLNALDAGVLTVVAAGNDGPSLDTIGSPSSAPWVLTAAASTQTGNVFEEAIEITAPEDIAGSVPMREASFTPQLDENGVEEALVVVDDAQSQLLGGASGSARDACESLVNGDAIQGHIALIQRGGCEFQVKLERVEQAGAVGAVVYNNTGLPIVMNGDGGSVGIPAVMIGDADGQLLVDRLAADEEITVKLAKGIFIDAQEDGNQMGDFSSRGPPLSDPDFLKPDVTAPGVDILAGNTPDPANGVSGELFQYLSGTSQSTPQVVGTAALLKEAHPDWSPATLKSAIMTTAYQGVVREDGFSADPFDMGAGHIDPNLSIDPGLVYDSAFADYAAYLCGLDRPALSAGDCDALAQAGFPFEAREVNLPSIALSELITGDTVTRRVTNVGPPARYTAETVAPLGIDILVEPETLTLDTGQSADFTVTFIDHGTFLDLWDFGQLTWTDGSHFVASPIALQPAALRAPHEVHLGGGEGSATLPVAFGYDGEYFATVHGLRAPQSVQPGFVDDDATNTFTFRVNNGVSAHELPPVLPDQLYLRVALFDELTDGADDLDLYLFYCPNNLCTQVGQSGAFTSTEEIDLVEPLPGRYVALVHGFETDQASGGPGANYTLFSWTFGFDDDVGNLQVTAPASVLQGDRLDLQLSWSGLSPDTRYLGAISHDTAEGTYSLTLITVDAP